MSEYKQHHAKMTFKNCCTLSVDKINAILEKYLEPSFSFKCFCANIRHFDYFIVVLASVTVFTQYSCYISYQCEHSVPCKSPAKCVTCEMCSEFTLVYVC